MVVQRPNPDHPVFKNSPGQKEAIRKAYGYPDEKSINEAIDLLSEWVQKQNHFTVKDLDREYLESYLITAKGSMEVAKKRLDKRFTLHRMMPELFDNIDIDKDFISLKKAYKHACIPILTPDLYRIVIDQYDKNHVDSFNIMTHGRYCHVNAEYKMMNDYIMGYETIIDLRGVSVTEVMTKTNPITIQKIMTMIVEGYGARIKATHVISESKFVDTIVGLLKQGMSEKIASRVQVHSSYETLTKFIPKENLPSDYGGTQPSIAELDERYHQQLCSDSHKARMKVVENYATDETKRLSSKFNEEYMGMPGSFKSLNVD